MHLYENRTKNHISVNIISEDGSKIIPFIFAPVSSKEFTYPALDMYVPSLLTKVCKETGRILFPNSKKQESEQVDVVIKEHVTEVEPEFVEEVNVEVVDEFIGILIEEVKEESIEESIELVKEEIIEVSKEEIVEEHNEVKVEDEEKPKSKRRKK